MKKILLTIALGLGLTAQAAQLATEQNMINGQATSSIKAGHIVAGVVALGTGAASYGLSQVHSSLAALPPALVTFYCIKSNLHNKKLHQDAARQAAGNVTFSTKPFPLAYVNSFAYNAMPDDMPLDQKRITLKSELASIMKCPNTDDALNAQLQATIDFLHEELDRMRYYTNIEDVLIPKAQEALHQNNPVEPDYFRTTHALLRPEVVSQLDAWCRAEQVQHWADKFFKIRYYVTKLWGSTAHYPYYSSMTYNGASEYTVQLLKQLGRLQAFKKVLECSGHHQNTRYNFTQHI